MFVTPVREARTRLTEPIWSLSDRLLVATGEAHLTGTRTWRGPAGRGPARQVQRDHPRMNGLGQDLLVMFDS